MLHLGDVNGGGERLAQHSQLPQHRRPDLPPSGRLPAARAPLAYAHTCLNPVFTPHLFAFWVTPEREMDVGMRRGGWGGVRRCLDIIKRRSLTALPPPLSHPRSGPPAPSFAPAPGAPCPGTAYKRPEVRWSGGGGVFYRTGTGGSNMGGGRTEGQRRRLEPPGGGTELGTATLIGQQHESWHCTRILAWTRNLSAGCRSPLCTPPSPPHISHGGRDPQCIVGQDDGWRCWMGY